MIGPAPALSGAAVAIQSASLAVPESHRWIPTAIGHVLTGAAELVEAGPGWTSRHVAAVRTHGSRALDALPRVRTSESVAIADGIAASVSVVRRWVAG